MLDLENERSRGELLHGAESILHQKLDANRSVFDEKLTPCWILYRSSTYIPFSMRIEELSRHPHLVDAIVSTLHESWGDLPPWAETGKVRERLVAGAAQATFPRTLVAVSDDGNLAATGSVKLFELPTQPDKVHWIGEIFVLPEYRGRGLGTRMTKSLSHYAFSNGVSQLFLYTPDQQSLYARLGWEEVSQEIVNKETVSIMALSRAA